MGMFDYYLPQPPLKCRSCGCTLGGWQGKDGPCALFVWTQGFAVPTDQRVGGDCQARPEVRSAERLPERFEIYTECESCGQWVEATGFCEHEVWVATARGRHLRSVPTAAVRIDDRCRQCGKCAEAWNEDDPAARLAGCPSCGALTMLPNDGLDHGRAGAGDQREGFSMGLDNGHFRTARPEDEPRLQAIRRAAFAPVFASFRAILGDEIYEIAQRRDDEAQEGLLTSLMAADSGWTLLVAQSGDEIVGFMAIRLNPKTAVGEIGLNAVDPAHAGKGIGTAMYEVALERMKEAGMKVATVGTGGDPSHAPARRAYEKAGFNISIPSVWMYRKL